MKRILLIFLLLPFFSIAQKKNTSVKKKVPVKKEVAFDGFVITGNVKGFPDGTPVSFINQSTGMPEEKAKIKQGKFVIKGKMAPPGFIGMIFNETDPVINMFLDNSNIKITGTKDNLTKLVITGSPSNDQFNELVNSLKPYEKIFSENSDYDSVAISKIGQVTEAFVRKYPSSYVAPLGIIRLYQGTENGAKAEELFKLIPPMIQLGPLGAYAKQLIDESKINPIGSIVPEFTQGDTLGKPVSLSSFKGKYVLLDFWASWCRPCRQENPNVVAAYKKFSNKNFTILGVSLDQAKKAWIDAILMDGLTWNHVSDLKGWQNAVAGAFQITSIPQNLLLDPQGRIIAKNLRGAALDRRLSALLH